MTESDRAHMTPLVTVVMPVYNLERYVAQSVESVMSQSLEAIELICVDDGSTDSSAEVLDGLAAKDSRITVVRQKNGGPSAARNAGVRLARGEYLHFLDGDDTMAPHSYERAHAHAAGCGLDVLCFDANANFETEELAQEFERYTTYYTRSHEYPGVVSGPELFAAMTANREYRPSPLLQLIRTQYLRDHDIAFHEGILHEDNPFSFRCMLLAKRAAHIPDVLAHRRFRESSTMTTPDDVRHFTGCLVGAADMLRLSQRLDLAPDAAEAANVQIGAVYRRAALILQALPRDVRDGLEWTAGTTESLLARFLQVHLKEVRTRDLKIRDDGKLIAKLQASVDKYRAADRRFLHRVERTIDGLVRKVRGS